jgi:hypothetical protein
MEIEIHRDPDHAVLRDRGEMTPERALGWTPALLAHPDYIAGMPVLMDMREIDFSSLDRHGIERLVAGIGAQPGGGPRCTALVVADDLGFGMTRVFEALVNGVDDRLRRVFRDSDAALYWLLETVSPPEPFETI